MFPPVGFSSGTEETSGTACRSLFDDDTILHDLIHQIPGNYGSIAQLGVMQGVYDQQLRGAWKGQDLGYMSRVFSDSHHTICRPILCPSRPQ